MLVILRGRKHKNVKATRLRSMMALLRLAAVMVLAMFDGSPMIIKVFHSYLSTYY